MLEFQICGNNMSLEITKKTPTSLHLSGVEFKWMINCLFIFPFVCLFSWSSYESGRNIQVECNLDQELKLCQVNTQKQSSPNPESKSIQKATVREEHFDGGTTYDLILETKDGFLEFPELLEKDVFLYAELINNFGNAPDSKSFKFAHDDRASQRSWAMGWAFGALVIFLLLLFTPISVDWQFDAQENLLRFDSRCIFWRRHYQVAFCEIKQIELETRTKHNYDSSETLYRLNLITSRPGLVISLIPDGWDGGWKSKKDAESISIAIDQILVLRQERDTTRTTLLERTHKVDL